MTDLIIVGYTLDPIGTARRLQAMLRNKGRDAVVIDPFKEERKNSKLFRKTLLSMKKSDSFIEQIEKEANSLEIDTIYTFSYGAIAILSTKIKAKKYVLIAPPLGKIHHKPLERIFFFLPGLREVRSKVFQNKLFAALFMLEEEKVLVVSSLGDGRVDYQNLEELSFVVSSIHDFKNVLHGDFMRNYDVVARIAEF